MKNIVNFFEFAKRFKWEPERRPVDDRHMPKEKDKKEYLQAVKEEISSLLDSLYKLEKDHIQEIQDKIWNDFKYDWKDILDDCLVNWDTPDTCAQKCLNQLADSLKIT